MKKLIAIWLLLLSFGVSAEDVGNPGDLTCGEYKAFDKDLATVVVIGVLVGMRTMDLTSQLFDEYIKKNTSNNNKSYKTHTSKTKYMHSLYLGMPPENLHYKILDKCSSDKSKSSDLITVMLFSILTSNGKKVRAAIKNKKEIK